MFNFGFAFISGAVLDILYSLTILLFLSNSLAFSFDTSSSSCEYTIF